MFGEPFYPHPRNQNEKCALVADGWFYFEYHLIEILFRDLTNHPYDTTLVL